jgi:hypothetical protein
MPEYRLQINGEGFRTSTVVKADSQDLALTEFMSSVNFKPYLNEDIKITCELIEEGYLSANELVNELQGYTETRDMYLLPRQDLLVFVRRCETNDRKRTQSLIDAGMRWKKRVESDGYPEKRINREAEELIQALKALDLK